MPDEVNRKRPLTNIKISKLPLNGILNTAIQRATLKLTDNIPRQKYGIYFPRTRSIFLTGVVKSASIVPRSHSLATTSAVSSMPISVIVMATEPGRIK